MYITHEYKRHFFASLTSVSDEIKEIWKVKTEKKGNYVIWCRIHQSQMLDILLCPSLSLSLFLSVTLFVWISFPPPLSFSHCPPFFKSDFLYISLSVCLTIYLFINHSVYLFICQSIYLPIHLSIYVCVCVHAQALVRARMCVCVQSLVSNAIQAIVIETTLSLSSTS